ncbi:MAG: hypothetical protein U0133_17845 [Gemmatimonadales bacterium]
MSDVELLAAALPRDLPAPPPPPAGARVRAPAVQLLECVLTLRRGEESLPERLDAFERRFPAVEGLAQLRTLVQSYKSSALFAKDVLAHAEPSSVEMLRALCDYLVRTVLDGPGAEVERLRLWAQRARPQEYLAITAPGFGLAGFQHLRMLFGANTTRPDSAMGRYVAAVLGRPVADVQALLLLEQAAERARVRLPDAEPGGWAQALERRRSTPGDAAS